MKNSSPNWRVVHYADTDKFAGTERHILELACAQRAVGVRASVACPPHSALAAEVRAADLEWIPIAGQSTFNWPAIRRLRHLLKSHHADLLHAHNGRTALSCAFAAKLAGRGAFIASQHFIHPARVEREGAKAAVFDAVHRWVNGEVDHFLACSHAARGAMLERGDAPPHKISAIPIGISPIDATTLEAPQSVRAALGLDEDTPIVVCAARLEREKDVGTLIEAMRIVVQTVPEATALIAGQGAEKDALFAQIRAAHLQDSVRLLGFYPDILSLINACDVLVLPSLAEPFGLVLLEAMAMSKPIVATRAGGPREIVAEGETGLLVTPQNPSEMAGAISQLLADKPARDQMGIAGQQRFLDNYTAENMARNAIEAYQKVLTASM